MSVMRQQSRLQAARKPSASPQQAMQHTRASQSADCMCISLTVSLLRCAARLCLQLTWLPTCVLLAATCLPAAHCSSAYNDFAELHDSRLAPRLHTSLCVTPICECVSYLLCKYAVCCLLQRRMGWQALSW